MPASTSRDVNAELAFLTRALKAPTLRDAVERLAQGERRTEICHRAVGLPKDADGPPGSRTPAASLITTIPTTVRAAVTT
jgi:hypothetical protein